MRGVPSPVLVSEEGEEEEEPNPLVRKTGASQQRAKEIAEAVSNQIEDPDQDDEKDDGIESGWARPSHP